MKKWIWALIAGLLACGPAAFADQYGGFATYANSGSIKPFARDLGGVLGSGTFHGARSLGLSGWDFGAQGGMQFMPAKNDAIMRNNGVRAFGIPWAQAEIGLPFSIDGFVRGISYEGLTVAGGGLRWGVLKSNDKPWAPQLLLSGVAHSVAHQDFSAGHIGGNIVGSMGTQKFTPYVAAGFDLTHLQVRDSVLDPTQNGRSVTTLESRYTGGLQYKPWQFFYMHAAYVLAHGCSGGEAGLGLRF